MKKSKLGYWLFLLPSLIPFVVTVIIPTITGLYYSLTDWNGIGNRANWIGFANYRKIFSSQSDFLYSFTYTLWIALASVILVNLIGFSLALLVTQSFRGANFMRAVFFMPNLIGGVLLGFTWQFIFTEAFSFLGKKTGLDGLLYWLSDTQTSTAALIIVVVWQLSGYMMIIYIAQLQNIPHEIRESAAIDGAGAWRILRHITLPLMMPAFTIGMFLTTSTAFKLFDQNLTLTKGGPAETTTMLALNIYNTAFKHNQLGVAQAKAVIFLISVSAITLTQLYLNKKREVEM